MQEAKSEWKQCLPKSLREASRRLRTAREGLTRKVEARLCRQREKIEQGDYVYLREERYDDSEHRDKLAAVAFGPYQYLR